MKKRWVAPADMDPECAALCAALNKLPGITTHESCCGHSKGPFHIWFKTMRLEDLPDLLYWFDGCHCGFYGWCVIARTDCGRSPVNFMIEGPQGPEGFEEAIKIAELIEEDLQPDPVA